MHDIRTLAVVGAVGGAGATRTAVECGATLARAGRDVAVLDAAFATQGLSELVAGRIDPDVTHLCLDADRPLREGLFDLGVETPGRLAVAPARAPFARVARAKTAEAARTFQRRVDEAAESFDHVLVDTPPVAANQAVAAVHAADRVAIVAPGTDHGRDARNRQTDLLHDVGAASDVVSVAVGGDDGADVSVPRGPTAFSSAPACLADDAFAAGVTEATEALLETSLGVEPGESVADRVRASVERVREAGTRTGPSE